MKTTEQIIKKIEEVKNSDFFGAKTSDLIGYLTFEQAKPYLVPEAKEEEREVLENKRESIIAIMLAYMPFAWDKANGERGLSASRSMDHFSVWTWLAGDENELPDLCSFQFYGKDNLVKICNVYGWDSAQWDDGRRNN